MVIRIADLVSKVMKILDENEEIIVDKMEFGYPGTNLPELIAETLPCIAERVVSEASLHEIDEWLELDCDFEWVSPGRGEMELPNDFMRLVTFRMSDWKHSVSSVISSDSPLYALRFSPLASRRTVRKAPAVAIVEGSCRRILEFIGSEDPGAYLERGGYLPLPHGENPEELWIPRSLVPDVAARAAAEIRESRE